MPQNISIVSLLVTNHPTTIPVDHLRCSVTRQRSSANVSAPSASALSLVWYSVLQECVTAVARVYSSSPDCSVHKRINRVVGSGHANDLSDSVILNSNFHNTLLVTWEPQQLDGSQLLRTESEDEAIGSR